MIASAKEIDALNITLFNSWINSTNVHLCNYRTEIFVIVVNTCVCRRSLDNEAVILSYPGDSKRLQGVIRGHKRLKEVRSVKTAIKSRRFWRHMVSENEPFRNHELYTTETLRHRPANID